MASSRRAPFLFLLVVVGLTLGQGRASPLHAPGRDAVSAMMGNSSLSLYSLISICSLPPLTPPSFFNITRISLPSGLATESVYYTGQTCQLLQAVAPVTDPRTKSAFICAYHRNNFFDVWGEPSLNVFDLTNPDQAVPKQRIPLPISSDWIAVFLYSNMVFDPVGYSVWVLAQTFEVGNRYADVTFLVKVDLAKGVSYNVTGLPVPNLIPINQLNHGGTFNAKSRKWILPLQVEGHGLQTSNLIAEFDVDAGKFTSISNSSFITYCMVWDSTSGSTYGFITPATSQYGVSYGKLNPGTGTWDVIKRYKGFMYAGKMVIDSPAGVIYGTLSGPNPELFVIVDIQSGEIKSSTPLPESSTDWSGLFGL